MDFLVPVDHKVELNESEKKDKYLHHMWEFKKNVEHESGAFTNYYWCSWYCHERVNKGTTWLGNKGKSGYHPNYYTIKIGQNTEKSPGLGETCRHSNFSEKPSANADMKNSQGVKCVSCP